MGTWLFDTTRAVLAGPIYRSHQVDSELRLADLSGMPDLTVHEEYRVASVLLLTTTMNASASSMTVQRANATPTFINVVIRLRLSTSITFHHALVSADTGS